MEDIVDILHNLLDSDIVNIVIIGFLAYIAFLWIAVILWVTKDITNRTSNIYFQIVSICIVIFLTPIFGLLIYLLLRPTRTLIEQDYEEMLIEQYEKKQDKKSSSKSKGATKK